MNDVAGFIGSFLLDAFVARGDRTTVPDDPSTDSAYALLPLLDSGDAIGNVLNVGTSTDAPIIELARRVIQRSGSKSRIQLVAYEEAYDEGFEELGRRKPDTTALTALAGWEPSRMVDVATDDVVLHERAAQAQERESALAP